MGVKRRVSIIYILVKVLGPKVVWPGWSSKVDSCFTFPPWEAQRVIALGEATYELLVSMCRPCT